MIDKNLILYLPFDDPDGGVAYDYSSSRADATLSGGAAFVNSKIGKALSLNGWGEALTAKAIPFSSNFTVVLDVLPSCDTLGWILNFSGVGNYMEEWMAVSPGKWCTLAFVREGTLFSVYKDGSRVFAKSFAGNPTGFSLNDPDLTGSRAQLDSVRMYNVAKSQADLFRLRQDDDVEYYVDGVNFKDLGVYVSASDGLTGLLARKDALTVNWDTYHGIVRDKARPRYKERTITLKCFIEAPSRAAYVMRVENFMRRFRGAGTQRLKVEYNGISKPLVYEVVCLEAVTPSKEWGRYNDAYMVGTFTIKLVEDEPVKRVLRHVGAANTKCTITVTSVKKLNIAWGDGTHTYNVSGTDKTVAHTYAEEGEYDIIVSGVIEDIEAFSTNAIVVWDNLQ